MRSLVPDVTPGPRSALLACVRANPGLHLRAVERATRLPLGQVLYHLDRLERMGLVDSQRDAGFRRYYASDRVSRAEKPILAALRHDVPRRIVLALVESPGLAHKEILARVGVAASTLSFHLRRLVASGVLVPERREGAVRYEVARPGLARREYALYQTTLEA